MEKNEIKIDTPTLKKLMGTKVKYKVTTSSWVYHGTITDIIRKQVDFGNGDYIPFKRIVIIETIND